MLLDFHKNLFTIPLISDDTAIISVEIMLAMWSLWMFIQKHVEVTFFRLFQLPVMANDNILKIINEI
jgi:hypothetical protein